LGELLKVYLIEDGKVIKHMFEFNGPFGTFSSRIDAAYALGLLPKNVRKDMHLLRKIRNDFGHNSSPVTFEDESISSKCGALYLDGKNNTSRPRGKFTRAMMAALGVIELSTQQTERCSVMEDHDIALNQKGIDSFREFLKDTDMDELLELVR
ncbi:MAG: MltR family transcriptional regulator, partial [Cyanobacteria bacterium J06629_19]